MNKTNYKFVIKYKNCTEEIYEDIAAYEAAETWFLQLKERNDINYIEVYHVVGDSWENRDPDYIVLSWYK